MEKQTFEEPCDMYFQIFTDKPDPAYKYRFLSPFEYKDVLIEAATKHCGDPDKILNAGRGNPNLMSVIPRYAFSILTSISTVLAESEYGEDGFGLIPDKTNIHKKFMKLLGQCGNTEPARFLRQAIARMKTITGLTHDDLIHQLVISTLGCFYPDPPRIQQFAEPVLLEFLDKMVYRPKISLKGKAKLFLTEGASAAIIYIFNSLKYNNLVIQGDTIGVLTPIFSPYLEIPGLRNYDLVQMCVMANESEEWEIPAEELEKIKDPNMRALFLVNPTNPTARSLSEESVKNLTTIVKKFNPEIIIITDNVYAPFADEFNTLVDALPRNIIGIYSFSKYFGTTGWRLGAVMMYNNNIIDCKLLKNQTDEEVHNRYKMINVNPSKIPFIERLMIDSRQVAEAHTAGLSTPQQTIMTLFAMHDYLDKKRKYNKKFKKILRHRINLLTNPIEYRVKETPVDTNYYVVINLINCVNNLVGGTDFGTYLQNHRNPMEFLLQLAKNYGTVILPAIGFGGPFWAVRVSLANLRDEEYADIGENLRCLIDDYYDEYKKFRKQERQSKMLATNGKK